jgi:hypothetical protein
MARGLGDYNSGLAQAADEFCEDCGYEPELRLSLSSFQMFAFSCLRSRSRPWAAAISCET